MDCYGRAAQKRSKTSNLTGKEKFLLNMFWRVKPLGEVPWQRDEEEWVRATADLLVKLENAHAGMQLNALGHCMSVEEVMRHDNAKRNDPDVGMPNPLLKSAPGAKMACIDAFAKLIGVENPYESFELCKGEEEGESTIIDVARRQTLQLDRPSDTVLLSSLRACA